MSPRVTSSRRTAVIGGFAALLAVTGLVCSGSAYADDGPADPAAEGYVGLCGVDGLNMTGGNIHDKPFVWKAVSSVPAPSALQGHGPVATLYAYQPRPGVPADQWNGDTLTATSNYTGAHPVAQATKIDFTLSDFLNEYPPMVDGLIQLRMYFGNGVSGTSNSQYPQTFIRVTGDHWSVVQGGNVDCATASATSNELVALGKAKVGGLPPASAAPHGGSTYAGYAGQPPQGATTSTGSSDAAASAAASFPSSASSTSSSGSPSSGAASQSAVSSPSSTAADGMASAADSTSSGSAIWPWVAAVVAALGGVIGGAWWYRRRTPKAAN